MNTRRLLRCPVSLILAFGVAALAPAAEPSPTAAATNALGVDLFHQLAADRPNQNLLFSPFSIESALALAYSGAAGDTKAEMARALHLPLDAATLPASFGALRTALEATATRSVQHAAEIAKDGEGSTSGTSPTASSANPAIRSAMHSSPSCATAIRRRWSSSTSAPTPSRPAPRSTTGSKRRPNPKSAT